MKNVYIKTAGAALLLSGVLVTALVTPGCALFGKAGSLITSTNTINTVSNYMSTAVAEGVAYGMTQNAAETTNYANLAVAAIGDVLGEADYSPGALEAALQKLPVAVLQTPIAGILTTTIESIYQIYWASDVKNAVNGNYAAKSYLGAVVAGIKLGESGNAPVIPLATLKRPAVRSDNK